MIQTTIHMWYTSLKSFFVIVSLSACSCASILNTKNTQITIHTNDSTQIAIANDTIKRSSMRHQVAIARSPDPISITVMGEKDSITHEINPYSTFPYFMNLFGSPVLWIGLYIDDKNGSRYGYPKNIYINPKEDKYYTQNPKYLYNNAIKLTPLKVVGSVNPSVELSYEKVLNSKYSGQLSLGYLLPITQNGDKKYDYNLKGFTASVEGRKYLSGSAPLGQYIAVNVHFLKNKYNIFTQYNPLSPSPVGFEIAHSYSEDVLVKKQTISSNFKMGYQMHIKKIIFDFSGGIGLKYRDVKHLNRSHITDYQVQGNHFYIPDYTNKLGKEWTFSLPLNVKIGWLFNKN